MSKERYWKEALAEAREEAMTLTPTRLEILERMYEGDILWQGVSSDGAFIHQTKADPIDANTMVSSGFAKTIGMSPDGELAGSVITDLGRKEWEKHRESPA